MKAKYIREARAVNPLFSTKEKRRVEALGQTYDVSMYMTIPVDFVEEGPHCWTHCCPGYMGEPPVCEPADEECRLRVKQWMEVERPQQLELIRQMNHPQNLAKLGKKEREHVKDLARVYGLEPSDEPVSKPSNPSSQTV